MNRRDLMVLMGLGTLATSLPVAIAACQSETTPTAGSDSDADTATREDGFAAIGTVADLNTAGFIANNRFQGKRVIVIKDPADASAAIAFDAVCPHAACTVTWEESLFDCNCHGSKFNADGTVSAGPATTPLGSFDVKIEGDQVLVKV